MFIVDDSLVHFPEDPGRTPYEGRRVVVIQSGAFCAAPLPRTVLVAPCSPSTESRVGDYDYRIPEGTKEPAFTKSGIVIFTSLVMPILKSGLKQCAGDLSERSWVEVQARVLRILGFDGLAST